MVAQQSGVQELLSAKGQVSVQVQMPRVFARQCGAVAISCEVHAPLGRIKEGRQEGEAEHMG